jgi:UTP--glucose-1-phosphate uridylyltransferase
MPSIHEALAHLPGELERELERCHFDRALFLRHAERLAQKDVDNRVRGAVAAPGPADIAELPAPGSDAHARLSAIGERALAAGECALVVLAGGMATRMGGVVKALVEAAAGQSFLELRMAEVESIGRRVGRQPPLWLMTSHATERAVREALGAKLDGKAFGVFSQSLSLRLTPEGGLFFDATGRPSEYAPGHGDLPDALRHSGLLRRFVDDGGRYLMLANVDNLGASLDPALIGWHLAHGAPVSCEVVDKHPGDRGGIPVRHAGKLIVLEEFRLPRAFDAEQVRVFNTNTFHFEAKALLDAQLEFTYFAVSKQVAEQPVIQFERLIGEVTSHLPAAFVKVPRQGVGSRFLPCKDQQELAARRLEIEAALRARGVIT